MRHLVVVCLSLIGISYSLMSENNGTFGGTIDGEGLLQLGKTLHKPMLTLIGMAIKNLHPCGEWMPWSPCGAARRGYFGSQTRTRGCRSNHTSNFRTLITETDTKLCEGFCPVGYNVTSNGFCIKLNTTRVVHDVAVKQCQQEGSYLVNIDSQEKLNDVMPIVQGFGRYPYIDGERKDAFSQWIYAYGSQRAFLKWDSGFPNKYTCLMLYLKTKSQYDVPCSETRPFLCEKTG